MALYIRASRAVPGPPSPDGEAREAQALRLDSFCAERGWPVVALYAEPGGAGRQRPELERLRHDAREGRFELVAVASLEALADSLVGLIRLLDELSRMGVGLVSLAENIESATAEGRAMFRLVGVLADLESTLARERALRGGQPARRRGTRSGGAIGRPRRRLDCVRALELRRQGLSYRRISQRMGVPLTTLYAKLRAYEDRTVVSGIGQQTVHESLRS